MLSFTKPILRNRLGKHPKYIPFGEILVHHLYLYKESVVLAIIRGIMRSGEVLQAKMTHLE